MKRLAACQIELSLAKAVSIASRSPHALPAVARSPSRCARRTDIVPASASGSGMIGITAAATSAVGRVGCLKDEQRQPGARRQSRRPDRSLAQSNDTRSISYFPAAHALWQPRRGASGMRLAQHRHYPSCRVSISLSVPFHPYHRTSARLRQPRCVEIVVAPRQSERRTLALGRTCQRSLFTVERIEMAMLRGTTQHEDSARSPADARGRDQVTDKPSCNRIAASASALRASSK